MSIIRCRFLPMTLAVFLFLSIMMTRHVADSQNSTSANGTAGATPASGGGGGASGGDGGSESATTVGSTTVGSGGQGLTFASTMMTYIVGVILAFLS